MLIVEDEVEHAIVACEKTGGVAERNGFLAVEVATENIIDVAVVGVVGESEAIGGFALDDRSVEETIHAKLPMRAEIDTQLGTELIGRAMAHEMDCTDFRSATKESALRTFDNLDAPRSNSSTTDARLREMETSSWKTEMRVGSRRRHRRK